MLTASDTTPSLVSHLNDILENRTNYITSLPTPRNLHNLPILITQQEWDGPIRYNIETTRNLINRLNAGSTFNAARKSLFRVPGATVGSCRYRVNETPVPVAGKIMMVDLDPPPSSATSALQEWNDQHLDLMRRFIIFIPANYADAHHYTANGITHTRVGHSVWFHFPPSWGKDRQPSPRATEAGRTYPDGLWYWKFIADYVIANNLVPKFSSAHCKAMLIIPVYNFVRASNAFEPTQSLDSLLRILRAIVDRVSFQLRTQHPAYEILRGVGRLGVSCNSFGATPMLKLVRSSVGLSTNAQLLRSIAIVDGVPNGNQADINELISTNPRDPSWLRSRSAPMWPGTYRAAIYQQFNGIPWDIARHMFLASGTRMESGGTAVFSSPVPGKVRAITHCIDTDQTINIDDGLSCMATRRHTDHDWSNAHGRTHLFIEAAFADCSDAFEP